MSNMATYLLEPYSSLTSVSVPLPFDDRGYAEDLDGQQRQRWMVVPFISGGFQIVNLFYGVVMGPFTSDKVTVAPSNAGEFVWNIDNVENDE